MNEPEPTASAAVRATRARSLPTPGIRRATVIGAGSFGTALAVLLSRGGLRTTLQTRTAEQAALLERERENVRYLPGVELPAALRIEPASANLAQAGLGRRAAVVSVAKGLVPPSGWPPTVVLGERLGPQRVACIGGPAH